MGVRVVFPDMGKDPSVQLIEKTITQNGTYDAITDGANGYSKVNVNVEGGGGSSDFSTAEVTISTTKEDVIIVRGCITVDEEGYVASVPNISVDSETPSTVNFILYKGTAFATIDNGDLYNIETTGDIVNDDGDLYITGDGTITIS